MTTALDNAGLLREMLKRADEASPEELELIHELHGSCHRLKVVLQDLAMLEQEKDAIGNGKIFLFL